MVVVGAPLLITGEMGLTLTLTLTLALTLTVTLTLTVNRSRKAARVGLATHVEHEG